MADAWSPVLDDLDARVTAAEAGNLGALSGWAPPEGTQLPMSETEQGRASRILERQHALMARLHDDQRKVARAMSAMVRPTYRPAALVAAPVYLDRLG